jgi:hypothetical protein
LRHPRSIAAALWEMRLGFRDYGVTVGLLGCVGGRRCGVCGMIIMMSRNTRMSNTQEVGGPKVETSLQHVGTDFTTPGSRFG